MIFHTSSPHGLILILLLLEVFKWIVITKNYHYVCCHNGGHICVKHKVKLYNLIRSLYQSDKVKQQEKVESFFSPRDEQATRNDEMKVNTNCLFLWMKCSFSMLLYV